MRSVFLFGFLLAFTLFSCTAKDDANNLGGQFAEQKSDLERDDTPDIEPEALREFTVGTTEFALDIYRAMAQTTEPGENLVFSPFSITTALAMCWAGSAGETELQMADTLHFPLDQAQAHAGMNALLWSMEQKGTGDASDLNISLANSLWGQNGVPFGQLFLDSLALNYGAGMNLLNFDSDPEGARQVINSWVLDHTNNLIDNLLPERSITPDTELVLVNAIYFMGKWQTAFPETETEDKLFMAPGGSYPTPFMQRLDNFMYAEGSDFQAIELPYMDDTLSMLVILPDATAFDTWEVTLDATELNQIVEMLASREVDLKIPKFEFESKFALADLLESLGMINAFHEGLADFSPMIPPSNGLFIGQVYHQARIAIDEKKTEAAAATAVNMVNNTGGGDQGPALFFANHPFFYFIRDRTTGALLFMGRVSHP